MTTSMSIFLVKQLKMPSLQDFTQFSKRNIVKQLLFPIIERNVAHSCLVYLFRQIAKCLESKVLLSDLEFNFLQTNLTCFDLGSSIIFPIIQHYNITWLQFSPEERLRESWKRKTRVKLAEDKDFTGNPFGFLRNNNICASGQCHINFHYTEKEQW